MLQVHELTKIYQPKNGAEVTALNRVSIDFADRGLVFLLGKSGSGKSTLLNLIGGLDSYTSGEIVIKGRSSSQFSQGDFDSYRNTFIGFIFQEFNILEEYSVGKNIELALQLQQKKSDRLAVENILGQVDLEGYYDRRPNELSGGQKQRVAIARALIKEPEIIMADEPTGALDSKTGKQVFDTLKKLSESKLVIVVSHDRENAENYGDRIVELADGSIISDRIRTASGAFVETPFHKVDETLLRIQSGHRLNADEVEVLNQMIAGSKNDVYVSLDSEKNRTFADSCETLQEKGSFVPTTPENNKMKQYSEQDFRLVHSRLPLADCFKMGASGLKHKKVRLFFTIFLSLISFALFGFSTTAAAFDELSTTLQALRDSGQRMVGLDSIGAQDFDGSGNLYFDSSNNKGISEEQIRELEEKTGKKVLVVHKQDKYNGNNESFNYSFANNIASGNFSSYRYYTGTFGGIIELENADDARLRDATSSKSSRIPKDTTEIAVTDYIASAFVKFGYRSDTNSTETVKIEDYDTLLGKKINGMTVVGVYSTDVDLKTYEKYWDDSNISHQEENALNDMKSLICAYGFVCKDYFSMSLSNAVDLFYQLGNFGLQRMIGFQTFSVIPKNVLFEKDFDPKNLGENDVVIGSLMHKDLYYDSEEMILSEIDRFFSENPEGLEWIYEGKTYRVRGIVPELWGEQITMPHLYCGNTLFQSLTDLVSGSDQLELNRNGSRLVYAIKGNNIPHAKDYALGTVLKQSPMSLREGVYWTGDAKTSLADDEIIVSPAMFQDTLQADSEEGIRAILDTIRGKTVSFGNGLQLYDEAKETFDIAKPQTLKIVGFSREYETIVGDEIFSELKQSVNAPRNIMIQLTGNSQTDSEILKIADRHEVFGPMHYKLKPLTTITSKMDFFSSFVGPFKTIFLYVALGFAVFSGFLFMNFIGTSISFKKKEIGILRAIGARSSDVFRIFFSESFIISVVNLVLSAVGVFLACFFTNRAVGISALLFGWLQILEMVGLCLLIAILATWIPTARFARKKPIDTINNR